MQNYNNKFQKSQLRAKYINVIKDVSERKQKKSYLERNIKKYNRSKLFRSFYPALSVASATFVGVVGAMTLTNAETYTLSWFATMILIGGASYILADLNEKAKFENLESYFFESVGKNVMIFTVLVSLAVSGFGGYLFNISMNDQSEIINTKYDILQDSVSKEYQEQIDILNAVIVENQKRMQSTSKWTRYHAQKDLANAQSEKTKLLSLATGQKSEIKAEQKSELLTASELLKYKGYIYTAFVVILELLYVYAFYFESVFAVNVENEKNDNYNFIDLRLFDFIELLRGHKNSILPAGSVGAFQVSPESLQIHPEPSANKVGFQFGVNKTPKDKEIDFFVDKVNYSEANIPNGRGGEVSYCRNCGKAFTKHPTKKYCTTAGPGNCKSAYWNKKNNPKNRK